MCQQASTLHLSTLPCMLCPCSWNSCSPADTLQAAPSASVQLNPVYVPQLQAVLRFPQSVGIVGGRPSSSLYFVGYQGESVIYLDPHDMQPVG
jgi:hypothetical protein